MEIKNILAIALAVLVIAGSWKVYAKAGRPGWGVIVPLYNAYLWIKIGGRPGWWLFLFIIPIVNLIVGVVLGIDVAKNFGKGVGFGLGLAFLPFIFLPILGFGD